MAHNKDEAHYAFSLLAEVATPREQELQTFITQVSQENSEDKEDGGCSALDSFQHAEGLSAFFRNIIFTCRDFQKLRDKFLGYINSNCNTGRGRRSTFTAKDLFLVVLCILKHG